MQKIITFNGIVRAGDELTASDGECMEIVNLRYKNGSLQPMAAPKQLASLPYDYVAVYHHSLASVYMCILAQSGAVHLYDENFSPYGADAASETPVSLSEEAVGVRRIEFAGNIACLLTDERILYAIFDTDCYRWLGERPCMPLLTFSTESVIHELTTDDKYYSGASRNTDNAPLFWKNVSKGYFDECISMLNEKGYYIDRALFRCAFRLFDGSYIGLSPIYYVEDKNSVGGLSRDSGNFYSKAVDTMAEQSVYTVRVQGFKPAFHFDSFNLDAWENIIVSLDVFSSGSIMGHKIINNGVSATSRIEGVYTSPSYGYEQYSLKGDSELWNDVAVHSLFYRVASYDLKGVLLEKQENVSGTQLALCNRLEGDTGCLSGCSAAYSYMFDGRLHLAAIRETLFKGYDGFCYLPATLERTNVDAVVFTEVKTTQGKAVVKRVYNGDFSIADNGGEYSLTPFLMYPDSRADATTFYIVIGGLIYKKRFNLTQHKMLDIAFYLNTKGGGLLVSVAALNTSIASIRVLSAENIRSFFAYNAGEYILTYSTDNSWMYGERIFTLNTEEDPDTYYPTITWRGQPAEGDTLLITISRSDVNEIQECIDDIKIDDSWEVVDAIDEADEVNAIEYRDNILKVSAVDNPFCFPPQQTYSPSSEPIIAVCSNTVALSQGQFGQHPLYVFCADGIKAMSVDASGSAAYTRCYPLSREVCVAPQSVRAIDGGVVFITEKGLMLLHGETVQLLSSALDTAANPLYNVSEDALFNRISAIADIKNIWCDKNFSDYCRNATVGFFYKERELVISNSEYSYSYIFSIENGTWSKFSFSFGFVSNSYPGFIALSADKGNTKIVTLVSGGNNSVLLFSRPLLWGGKLYKRVLQMMLHADVSPADSSHPFNGLACYLLCSNDGVNFKLVTGSERHAAFSDMIFPYMPTRSYRYFMVAIAGCISAESIITGVEMYIDTAWNNRLR